MRNTPTLPPQASPRAAAAMGNRPAMPAQAGGADRVSAQPMGRPVKLKAGGKTKKYAKGGVTRGDGACTKGHTRGKMV
jgi:hypothetical protein